MVRLIGGILRRDGGDADPSLVGRMLDAMTPIGVQHARDICAAGPAALGVLALAPAAAPPPGQPRVLRNGPMLVAADLRLYGRGSDAVGPRDPADDDAALMSTLAAQGWRAPTMLHGDFAYACWDADAGILDLVRDHFGVRPLQYAHLPGRHVAFASLPAALLETGLAARELDPVAIEAYHGFGFAPQELTYYREIRSVLSAHVLCFSPDRAAEPRRYWRLPIPRRLPFESDQAELAAELGDRLDRAVRRRLPPAGAATGEMSGGLDSTPIAVLAARALRAGGRTFHGYSMQEPRDRPGLPFVDEAPDVEAAAAGEPNLTVVPVPSPGLYRIMGDGFDADDFNPRSQADPWNFLLCHAAGLGGSVMLAGWGGDEIVTHAGRGAFAELFWAGRWRMLRAALAERSRRLGGTLRGRFLWSVVIQSLPFRLRHWVLRRIGRDDDVGAVQMQPRPFLAAHRRGRQLREPVTDGPDSRRNRRGYAEAWWMPKRLEVHAQRAARYGMSYAFPMLDLDLIDFAMSIPGIFFCNTPGDRSMIRAATEGILPDSIRSREDKLMPYPLESLRLAEDRPRMIETLRGMGADRLVREFVDMDALIGRLERMPGADAVRAETLAAAARGAQPAFDDNDDANALILTLVLAEHSRRLDLPD